MPPNDTDGLGDDLPGLHDDLADADSPPTEGQEAADSVVDELSDSNPFDDPRSVVEELADSNPFDDPRPVDPASIGHGAISFGALGFGKRPPVRHLRVWIGGLGLGLALVGGFSLLRGDADDAAVAAPPETPVVETAPPSTEAVVVDTEAPAVVMEDEPPAVAVPEAHTIDVAGEQVDLTVWLGPTATDWLVAAPSLNSDVDDLAGLAATLAWQMDCANVVAFDSSLTSAGLPIFDEIIDKWLDGFGFEPDAELSTLGSSATALDALIAGIKFGAVDILVFSPSDPFDWESISPPIGITYATHVVARITTGDLQYRPVFDGWIEAELPTSFESYVVDGQSHGTAFFNEAAAEPVLNEVTDHICHFAHDGFEFPEGFEQGSTSAWRR